MNRKPPTKKRPAQAGPSATKPAKRTAIVRFKFASGADDVTIPLAEERFIVQRQHLRMAESDSPGLREAGERKLRESAEREAASIVADLQRANAARLPRARSAIRKRIIDVMRSYKRKGTTFKRFFDAWERDHLDGLRLSRKGDAAELDEQKYEIADEENADSRNTCERTYKTLRDNLWAKA